jgi:hypothetical protein
MDSKFVSEVIAKLFEQPEGGVPVIHADGKEIRHFEIVSPGDGHTYINLITEKYRGMSR